MELIAERLTGRAKDHYVSPAMEHGTATENDARLYYEGALRVMCEPVGFILHPKYDFTGCSPDSLVGSDGVLEVKCPETTTHLEYVQAGKVPDEYMPQIMWELACTERKWADFVSFDPRILDDRLRFFYRRVERDEALIDYYTQEVLKLNAEIEYFFAERNIDPKKLLAPFPVEIIEEELAEGEVPMSEADEFAAAAELLDRVDALREIPATEKEGAA